MKGGRMKKTKTEQIRHGTMQRAKESWLFIQFSDLQLQKVVISHSNPPASLEPPPRPQRFGESPGNMATYELRCWKGYHPPCPAVLQCVNAAVCLNWLIPILVATH